MSSRPHGEPRCPTRVVCRLAPALAFSLLAVPASAQLAGGDRIDITGRQNQTLGSGARAMGMGGAFLARADDATAASWNPAGLSYLRLPELTVVGVTNDFAVERLRRDSDDFRGRAIDFAAFTVPVAIKGVRGAVQVSYQRAISFDGTRTIREFRSATPDATSPLEVSRGDDAESDGGFDVIALGTGLRLTRSLRAGVTVNRWLGGYSQHLVRTVYGENNRPLREFDLSFRPSGWNFNVGVMWSPVEPLNIGAVYKTPFTASVDLSKARQDALLIPNRTPEVTTNRYPNYGNECRVLASPPANCASERPDVELDFPASFGVGLSWRALERLTLSADFTQTRWSQAAIRNYFEVPPTPESAWDPNWESTHPPETRDRFAVPIPSARPAPEFYAELPYPAVLSGAEGEQKDKQEIRVGVEWVLIKGAWRVPLRAGYFNDRQILPNAAGKTPRFSGFTAGIGVGIAGVLCDVAYVYQNGDHLESLDVDGTPTTVRSSLTTKRLFVSVIVRLPGRP